MTLETGPMISRFDDNWLTVMRTGMTEHADSRGGVSLRMKDATDRLTRQIVHMRTCIDRIVAFRQRRRCIRANFRAGQTGGHNGVACIGGARTGEPFLETAL